MCVCGWGGEGCVLLRFFGGGTAKKGFERITRGEVAVKGKRVWR